MPRADKAGSKESDKHANGGMLSEKAVSSALAKVEAYIEKSAKAGVWGYHPGESACVEPTAFCGMALRKKTAVHGVVSEFFCKNQNSDGGWSTSPGLGKSDWTSGLALLALRVLDKEAGQADKTRASVIDSAVKYLFDSRTEFYGWLAKALLLISQGDKGINYPRGWPWSPGCFHWVEPTAYTLLALKLPATINYQDSKRVIERADNFLLEHSCKAGGWNHGNDLCLNVYLPPFAVTSAEALIALQNHKDAEPVRLAIRNLHQTIGYDMSAMSLAWASLARQSLGIDDSDSIKMLLDRQHPDGSFGPNLMVCGLSMLALQAHLGDNALKVPA